MHNQEALSASIFSGFCMLCIFPKAHALCGFIVAHLAIHLKLLDLFSFVQACLERNLYVCLVHVLYPNNLFGALP